MLKNGPFRWFLASLLAMWLPLCCCSLASLLAPRGGCGAAVAAGIVESQRPSACCGEDGAPRPGSLPDDDRHEEEDEECACGSHRGARIAPERQVVTLERAVFAYFLLTPGSAQSPPPRCAATRVAAYAVHERPMTLLRQHCALTV